MIGQNFCHYVEVVRENFQDRKMGINSWHIQPKCWNIQIKVKAIAELTVAFLTQSRDTQDICIIGSWINLQISIFIVDCEEMKYSMWSFNVYLSTFMFIEH